MPEVQLDQEELAMLAGEYGRAVKKSMEILRALGTIYGARRMVPVSSVQIAGVSYDNLGEAGLQFLTEMAEEGGISPGSGGIASKARRGGGKVRVLTTLNPAGMDIENPASLGIDPVFAASQRRVIEAFARMGVTTTCTCTPYLAGNSPSFGDHIAWAESSAVCYANSVLGARTNREGGPSALAAALTGRTPEYGLHLDAERQPGLTVDVRACLNETADFGALGQVIGDIIQSRSGQRVPYLRGVTEACQGKPSACQGKPSLEMLKSFCASIATYGGVGLFHIEGVTPESGDFAPPIEKITITQADLQTAAAGMSDAHLEEVDFVSLGCPHLSIEEIARIAELLKGRQVRREFWITTARPTRLLADRLGYSEIIEASGAKFATDTCCVVAPIRGRFHALATDSAKACYYAASKNRFKTAILPFDQVVELAVKD